MNKRNRYDNEFKAQAVKLALEIGQNKACNDPVQKKLTHFSQGIC